MPATAPLANAHTSVILFDEVPCPADEEKVKVSILRYAGIPSDGLMMSQEEKQIATQPEKSNMKVGVEILNARLL